MSLKITGVLILLVIIISCNSNDSKLNLYELSSGKQVKVTNISRMDFPEGDPALVMNYETDISIENIPELRKEIDEIWVKFQKDVEAANLEAAAIRAVHTENNGFIRNSEGYGFIFIKSEDGKWHNVDDEKK